MKYLVFAIAIIFALFDVSAENLPELDAELVQLIEENKQTELQNFLKKKRQSTDAKNAALRLAVEKNRVKIACMLIHNGADPCIKDENGITSLMIAAIKNYPSMAGMLMKMNGDSRIKDNKGNTALIHSVRENNMEVFNVLYKFLIAEPWSKEITGDALFIALELDRPEMAKILIERLSSIESCIYSERKGVRKIQEQALFIALKLGRIEMAKLLIKDMEKVEMRRRGEALLQACGSGDFDLAKSMLEKGADANVIGEYNPVISITNHRIRNEEDCIKLMKLLIEYGADVNKRGKHGDTVLLQALREKRFAVAKFLLKNGASIFAYNGVAGDSAIGYLIKYAFEKIAKKFESIHIGISRN